MYTPPDGSISIVLWSECITPTSNNADAECTKRWADFNVSALHEERIEALTVALVPVPLAWGIAYFVLFLIRWVKRGGFETKL